MRRSDTGQPAQLFSNSLVAGLQVSDDELYIVVNAACREKDLAHINVHLDAWKVVE